MGGNGVIWQLASPSKNKSSPKNLTPHLHANALLTGIFTRLEFENVAPGAWASQYLLLVAERYFSTWMLRATALHSGNLVGDLRANSAEMLTQKLSGSRFVLRIQSRDLCGSQISVGVFFDFSQLGGGNFCTHLRAPVCGRLTSNVAWNLVLHDREKHLIDFRVRHLSDGFAYRWTLRHGNLGAFGFNCGTSELGQSSGFNECNKSRPPAGLQLCCICENRSATD